MEEQPPSQADSGGIDCLPVDVLAHILSLLPTFRDLAKAGGVSKKWRCGVKRSLASRRRLSFAGQSMGDAASARFVRAALNLQELNLSRSCWGCQITDVGLMQISSAKCVAKLTSISLWGMTGITDKGIIHLISQACSLEHLNVGGTFVTDDSLYAIADNCYNLKSIILWSCRHVTEKGLVAIVSKCRKLESINVGSMRIPSDSFHGLIAINPALQIRYFSQNLLIKP